MSDINIVRLSTGEEVVAKVSYDKGFYTLTDAILLVPAGEGKIGMVPFVPLAGSHHAGCVGGICHLPAVARQAAP